MGVSIRDVAEKLGLSITTVSRALDGYDDVSQATRERVVVVAQEMGYTPNRAARQLRRQRADSIGYILPSSGSRFSDPFFSEFISGLGDEAVKYSYDLLISTAPGGQLDEQELYQRWVHSHKVDGFVLNRLWLSDWRVRYLSSQHIPFVSLERSDDPIDYPSVQVECIDSITAIIKHMVDGGYQRVAFIGGPSNLTIHADRYDAFCKALSICRIPLDPVLVASADLTSMGGYQVAKRLLWLTDPPNAFICINDQTAYGVLRAAHEEGRFVGKDIVVSGFDGLQESLYTQPTLTTVDQPLYEIARHLAGMLIAEIIGQPLQERQVVIQPVLHIRESSGDKVT